MLARVLLVVLAANVICHHPAHAKRFFVAQTSNASDENRGSRKKPFATIAFAVSKARPGDSIIVGRGDYRQEDSGWGVGTVPILNSGIQRKAIKILAEQPGHCVVSKFLIQDAHHLVIVGFEFRGLPFSEVAGWQDMPTIVRDAWHPERPDFTQNWDSRRELIETEFATYFQLVEDLEYETAIDLENCTDISIDANHVDGFWAGIQTRGCSQLTIENNTIAHCVNGIYSWLPAPALTDSVIRGNSIQQCLDNGIDLRQQCRNVRVTSNTLTFNGRSHVSLQNGAADCVIADNWMSHAGYYSETMQFPGSSAVSIHSSLPGNQIINNYIAYQTDLTGIDGNGIILDLLKDGSEASVEGNYVWRNAGSGINTTLSPNARITMNVIAESGFGATQFRRGAGIKLSRTADTNQTIVGNYFLFNRAAGILSEDTILEQRRINRNTYFSRSPLIWDSFQEGERSYDSIWQVREHTPWEKEGMGIRLP